MGAVFREHPKQMQPAPRSQVRTEHPAQGFDPRHLSTDLLVWCRADAGVETNGSTVSKWRDMSGKGRDFSQGTASSQPAFKAKGQGGKPEIFFDDDKLTGSDLYATLADKGEWAIIIVLGKGWSDPNGVAASNFSNSINVFVANPAVGHIGIAQLSNTYGGFSGGIYAGGGYSGYRFTTTVTESKISPSEPVVVSLYSSASGITSRQNGVDGTTAAATDLISGASTMQLGDAPDNNSNALEYYYGPISELIIFDGALNQNDRDMVEQYLGDRYGIHMAG